MAVKIVFVFVVSLILGVSLSLPISLDVKTEQSTDSVPESELIERASASVLSSEAILRVEEDKLVQSLSMETLLKTFESYEADHGKRIRRHIATSKVLCPEHLFAYRGRCLTKEQYGDVESEGSDDYEEER